MEAVSLQRTSCHSGRVCCTHKATSVSETRQSHPFCASGNKSLVGGGRTIAMGLSNKREGQLRRLSHKAFHVPPTTGPFLPNTAGLGRLKKLDRQEEDELEIKSKPHMFSRPCGGDREGEPSLLSSDKQRKSLKGIIPVRIPAEIVYPAWRVPCAPHAWCTRISHRGYFVPDFS